MSTLLDIGTASLTAIGQLGAGQTPAAEDAAWILREANLLLGKNETKRLMLSQVTVRQYAMAANRADYSLGLVGGADFNAVRPTFIESGQVCVPGSQVWLPLSMLTKAAWDAIRNKNSVADVPESLYCEYFPSYVALHFDMAPRLTPNFRLGCWEPLTKFATVFDEFSMALVYEEFLESNLAIMLAPLYDQPINPALADRARDAAISVMQYNAQMLGTSMGEAQTLASPNIGQPVPGGPGGGGGG